MSGAVGEHVVEARTHGRFLVRAPQGEAAGILVGFHGQGENAALHLAELEAIPGLEGWARVAVDALHAFYDRRGERVLRSWMTRDLREAAIADNVAYVDAVLDRLRGLIGRHLPVALLGFSQGASMAWRAALLGRHEVAAVIALAGDVPPELRPESAGQPSQPPRALIAHGDADSWYDAERLAADLARLAPFGIRPATLTFPGGHEWTEPFRAAVTARLSGLD